MTITLLLFLVTLHCVSAGKGSALLDRLGFYFTFVNQDTNRHKRENFHRTFNITTCNTRILREGTYNLTNETLHVFIHNRSFDSSQYRVKEGRLFLCREKNTILQRNKFSVTNNITRCTKWEYDPGEYQFLENGSISLLGEVLPEDEYEFLGDNLLVCAPDVNKIASNSTIEHLKRSPNLSGTVMIYVGNIEMGISIVALVVYMLVFTWVPDLRNLPGWNLASMCVALMLSYSFSLIGQVPEIIGTPCLLSAVFLQYFFLSSFFWMNVMSFDVWRTLRNATAKLRVTSSSIQTRRFVSYSTYGWGMPLAITIASVVADNTHDIPEKLRPFFGKHDICWFNSAGAKTLFFASPAFAVFITNGVFFGLSARMIIRNTMKTPNSEQIAAKRNFILYARLGVIMGITWLTGIIATLADREEIWFVFILLNSSQGILVLVLFTCSRKVCNYVNRKTSERLSKVSWKISSV